VTHLRGNVADQLIEYCRTNHVSILIIAHPSHSQWDGMLHGSVTNELLHKMPEVDVLVIGNNQQDHGDSPVVPE
jgi:K+-sensing histidine kinase KdpD